MQIIGYFQWNKNLKNNQKDIIKIFLPKKELAILLAINFCLIIITYFILSHFKDAHPLLDSITTVVSIGGMYLTVRRAIEQWAFWMVVNLLSVIMWIEVLSNGVKVYSTVAMWLIYLMLAIYFYITWHKEIKSYLDAK
jgi:nicotinamide mononucleotide transporter